MIFSERYSDIPRPIEEILDPNNEHIIMGVEDIKQTRNKIIIGYRDKRKIASAVYDKNTGDCKVYPYLINSNLNNVPAYQYTTFFDDEDNMIFVCETDKFLEIFGQESDRAKIKNETARKKVEAIMSDFNEYSNPVIIRYKLKQNSKL
jgi:hypothetical protein